MTTTGITQFSNTRIFPLTYVLKYDPPMIGMVYKSHEKDTKRRIYKIYLHGLVYKNDPEAITRQLFQEHTLHINENNVSHKQVNHCFSQRLPWEMFPFSKKNTFLLNLCEGFLAKNVIDKEFGDEALAT